MPVLKLNVRSHCLSQTPKNDEGRVADLVLSWTIAAVTTYVDPAVPNPQASRYLAAAGERCGFAVDSITAR